MDTNYTEILQMLESSSAELEAVLPMLAAVPVLIILSFLIERIIFGVLSKKLAGKKGYTGYFFTGFFLGALGFVYVVFLPDMKLRKYVRGCAVRLQMMDNRIEQLEESPRR